MQPGGGRDASDVHLAVEEIEQRFQEVIHRHSPRKHIHVHVIASRVRLEMKSAFSDVKDRIKVREKGVRHVFISFCEVVKPQQKIDMLYEYCCTSSEFEDVSVECIRVCVLVWNAFGVYLPVVHFLRKVFERG